MTELEGAKAKEYCLNHLETISTDGENWLITYKCPVTGIQWLQDYPHSEYHGGGSPRLRRLPLNL